MRLPKLLTDQNLNKLKIETNMVYARLFKIVSIITTTL
jgi:hypothetical protein